MNPLQYIQKNWDFKKNTKQNVITFNNVKEKEKKTRNKMVLLSLIVVGLSLLLHNPTLALMLLITSVSFGSEYIFKNQAVGGTNVCAIDSTHFAVAYRNDDDSRKGYVVIGTISGTAISYGTIYKFNDADSSGIKIILIDSTHILIGYSISTTSLACIAGTISNGNQISFGSASTIESGWMDSLSISMIDSTHFVGAFRNTSSYKGIAFVGTISGTSISVGNKYEFNDSMATQISVLTIDSTHIIIIFSNTGNSNYGSSIVGTISGTSISFGSKYTVVSSDVANGITATMIDSTHFAVAYRDAGNSDYGTCKIGIYSSGTLSYGSAYIFNSGISAALSICKIDSSKFLVSYWDYAGGNGYGLCKVGTISSGTTISYSDAYTFNAATTYGISSIFLDASKFVITYVDDGNSNYGTAILGTATFVVAPTVTTQDATSVAQTTCTGNGNITATGGANATRRGICYKVGTSGDPTTADSVAYDDGDFGTGAFTKAITGLTAGTGYRVRAYATNSAGTSYGSTVQVTTLSSATAAFLLMMV